MENYNPRFSVLIANYNNGMYISQAIESVLNQTYSNWEIIIVDDASTDNSIQIIQKYLKDPRVFLFQSQMNKGCGYTKRKCIDYSKGEICGFLDPDDILDMVALEKMVRKHYTNNKCSLVYSKNMMCDANMNILKEFPNVKAIPKNSDYLTSINLAVSHFSSFKKSAYLKTDGIDPSLLKAVDQDLYYKLEEVGMFDFLDEVLYYYRIHKGGISTGQNIKHAWLIHISIMNTAFKRRLKNNYINISGFKKFHYYLLYSKFYVFSKLKAQTICLIDSSINN